MNRPKCKTKLKNLVLNSSSDTDDGIAADSNIKYTKCKNEGTKSLAKLSAADVKARTHLQPRRTKLDAFIYKRQPPSNNIDNHLNSSNNDESDFETPEKKRLQHASSRLNPINQKQQKAQKRKPSEKSNRREKKQPNIKSALMRNEMLFSDIVAQHTIADNFNPDEMQLVLALSKSEAEVKKFHSPEEQFKTVEGEEENEKDKVIEIRAQLERYGFRTGTRADYENLAIAFGANQNSKRKKNCKWADKITALTLRNVDLQAKKLQENIKNLLINQHINQTSATLTNTYDLNLFSNCATISPYEPMSTMIKNLLASSLPVITTRDGKRIATSSSHKLEEYFVRDLFEICHLGAGYLLKDWSRIEGREASPTRLKEQNHIKTKENEGTEDFNETKIIFEENQAQSLEKDILKTALINKQTENMVLDVEQQSLSQTGAFSPTALVQENIELIDSDICSLHESTTEMQVHSPDIFANSMCDSPEHLVAAACEQDEEPIKNARIIDDKIYAGDVDINSIENVDVSLVDLTQCVDLEDNLEKNHKSDRNVTTPCRLDLSKYDEDISQIYVVSSNEIDKEQVLVKSEKPKDVRENAWDNGILKSSSYKKVKLTSSLYTEDRLKSNNSLFKGLSESCDKFKKSSSFNSLHVSCSRKCSSIGNVKYDSISDATDNIDLSESITDSDNNSSNNNDDDDVIILSDDEIHYSTIKSKSFRANRRASIIHNQTKNHAQATMNNYTDDSHVNFDDMEGIVEHEDKKDMNYDRSSHSMLDLLTDFSSCENIQEQNDDKKLISSAETVYKNAFLINESLEEALAVAAALEDDSYSMSAAESTAPMKRFSMGKNNEQFNKFLSNVIHDNKNTDVQMDDGNTDFDEFDGLIYKANDIKTIQKPIGLEQLLTAEIRTHPLRDTTSTQDIEKTIKNKPIEKSFSESCQKVKVNSVTYLVRESHTPEPIYEEWSDAKLHNKLNEYGIKPLKRYQAIKMLYYIYRSTHPIVIDEEIEDADAKRNHKGDKIQVSKNNLINLELIKNNNNEHNKDIFCLSDNGNGDILLDNFNSNWDIMLEDEDYIFQTNITKKTQQPLLPLHKAWSNLVASNKTLHEHLLMYKPIDLECIYRYFKSINYRYDPKHIRKFFDKRCIIFSYES